MANTTASSSLPPIVTIINGGHPQIPPGNPQQRQPQSAAEEEEHRELTCEICIEPMSISDKNFRNADKCSHPFCTDCVIKYIRVQLEDNSVGDIKCPAFNCDHTLDKAACAALVGPAVFVRWCDLLSESAILGFDKCYCPNPHCNVVIVNECGGTVRKSKCPDCGELFCFECGRVWHAGFGCEEAGEEMDENDVALGRLVEEKEWMRCPQCKHFVERVAGCRIVHCRCKIRFCYRCGKPVNEQGCSCNSTATAIATPLYESRLCSIASLLFPVLTCFFVLIYKMLHDKT